LKPFVIYHAQHISQLKDAVTLKKVIKVIKVSDVTVKKLDKLLFIKKKAFQSILNCAENEAEGEAHSIIHQQ